MLVADIPTLRQLALQYRTMAVDAIEQGDFGEGERYESQADSCYARAGALGDTGIQLPRVRHDQTAQDRFCGECRKRFKSVRADARLCSPRCRKAAARRQAREQSDPIVASGPLEADLEPQGKAQRRGKEVANV